MKRIGENQIKDKKIDETIRAAFGFSDEQIQAELDNAAANPDTSPELEVPDDEFQKILQKIQERGIQPVPFGTEGKAPVTPHPKKKILTFRRMRRTLIAAAVLGVVFVGFSLNSVGKSATKYRVINDGGNKNNIAWSSVKWTGEFTDEKEAYDKIRKRLKIPVLKMGYEPDKMTFDNLVISDETGIMRFLYQGKFFRIYQFGANARRDGVHGNDRKSKVTDIVNPWMNEKLEIYERVMENGEVEYSVDITISDFDTSYYVSGVMNLEEFSEVAEGLYID